MFVRYEMMLSHILKQSCIVEAMVFIKYIHLIEHKVDIFVYF